MWAYVIIMKVNKVKGEVLYMGQDNPKHKYWLGREWTENSPEKKDLDLLKDNKINMSTCSPERQSYSGLH